VVTAAEATSAGVAAPGGSRWVVGVVAVMLGAMWFEPDAVWFAWGPVEVRTGQALALAVIAVATVSFLVGRRPVADRVTPLLLGGYAIWLLISWWGSDVFPRAVHATTFRLVLMAVLGLAVWWLVRSGRERRVVVASLVVAGVVAALVGMAAMSAGGDWWFSDSLRGSPTTLGPHQRLTRPFNHANVAAMVLAPTALLAVSLAARRRQWWWAVLAIVPAVVLTYSRMAPVALLVGLVVAGVLATRWAPWVIGAVGLGVVSTLVASAGPGWSVRLDNEGNRSWYGREVNVVEFDPATGEVAVTVANNSRVEWSATGADRVELSLRWRSPGGTTQFLEERFDLGGALRPSQERTLAVISAAPDVLASGEYLLVVDLLRDRDAYFGEATGDVTALTVRTGSAGSARLPTPVVERIPDMARSELWRAAVRLTADHPLVGVGNGNFRLLYGPELGLTRFPRSHAHSLYLETAASSGVPALAMLVGLLAVVVGRACRLAGRLDDVDAAVVGALVAMCVHGLVDWPLVFTSAGSLFFVLVALAARTAGPQGSAPHVGAIS
jgi:hypothetical protein